MLMPSIFGDSFFDDFFNDFAFPARRNQKFYIPASNMMRADVKAVDGGFELDIDLPGYRKEDVSAELKDGYMTITASTNSEVKDEENAQYLRRERYSGTCTRSFYVGEEVTENDIKAKFENGILKLFVPKKEKQPEVEQKRLIAIEG